MMNRRFFRILVIERIEYLFKTCNFEKLWDTIIYRT